MTVGIPPRKQSLRSARRFMLGRLRLASMLLALVRRWIILPDLVRLRAFGSVYCQKHSQDSNVSVSGPAPAFPAAQLSVEAKALRALLILG